MFLSLDSKVFQIETNSQKIVRTYSYDLDTIGSYSLWKNFLIFAGKKQNLIINVFNESSITPQLLPKCEVDVGSNIQGVSFLSPKGQIRFAVLANFDKLIIYHILLKSYFVNSEVILDNLLTNIQMTL